MKNKIIWLCFLSIIFYSCYHEWVFRPEIKGYVYDDQIREPIVAKLYFLPVEEDFTDTISTNLNGKFLFSKISSRDWALPALEKPKGPPTSNKIIVTCPNFVNDTIDFTEVKIEDNVIMLDTIYLKRK
ncbi:hypothetical protein BC749_102354 [Flavobacterium araucananum]|uniref:Carboxypeptidase regulatory-like domain-containing protein n=1 Tax=Flavobacterium araucananum TaxID=946678 RepID=A0A227P939_9FLAO|nr:hypothetical protein [Flavobacterium araucananum]OXG06460.1 hypothetical protein B0A64_10110 [Flavobacterium araucananum]PWK00787.1 hypothetical protein BC749_102354 [Flavobacterium araucananum]